MSQQVGGRLVTGRPTLTAVLGPMSRDEKARASSGAPRETRLGPPGWCPEGLSKREAYLAQPSVRVVTPGAGHRAIAADLAATPGLRSDEVPDVFLAALAIEHGLVLATHDHGFRRFTGLRVVDPLT